MRAAQVSATLCVGALLAATSLAGIPGQAASAAVRKAPTPCSSGLVALTFDDGPSSPSGRYAALTPGILSVLQRQQVPATFFVLGEQVRANPEVLRRARALGFTIGNHTFSHENLTKLDGEAISLTLRRTRRAIVDAGVRPSGLMRPPYGSIDERVRAVVRRLGLVPVLWTADPRDWAHRSASAIADSTLGQLRPRQANIVLLHDGVSNSGNTLLALPRIILAARARGYCFAGLDTGGRPTPPIPLVRVSGASTRETPGGALLTARITLDRPTSRPTSVRVRTIGESATPGHDFVRVDRRVSFPLGARVATVRVRVLDDLRDEAVERLTFLLSEAQGLRIKDATGVGVIRDDDLPPRLSLPDAKVTEPVKGAAEVSVTLRLSRASERPIRATVYTATGTADATDFVPKAQTIVFAPGEVTASFTVTVLADAVVEGPETFTVRATDGSNVDLTGAAGVVAILPPPQ